MHRLLFVILFLLATVYSFGQKNAQTDSLIDKLMHDQATPGGDQGISLIQTGNYTDANQFYSGEISKDESDRTAYYRRGVANWELNDSLGACRDWSAVLALGDTEMFRLLDSKCHGSMIIANDTITSKQFHKMWGGDETRSTANQNAKTVVEEMPGFPGGDTKLIDYLSSNVKAPKGSAHGTVYVNFIINPKGKILFPYIVRGIGKEYDKEALRLIRNMPAWSPGKQKNKAVYVRSSLPVRF